MKRILGLGFMIVLFISLFACVNKEKPSYVAIGFLTALYNMQYDTAKNFCTSDSYGYIEYRKLADSYIYKEEKKNNEQIKVTIKDTKIDGDKATCTYKLEGINDQPEDEQTIDLIKKNGKWYIDLHAENLDFNNSLPVTDSTFENVDTLPE